MQIFSKDSGITLVMLVITIIVLLIIVGITLTFGISNIDRVIDNRTTTELSIIEQAIIQQYTLLISENQDNKKATEISTDTLLEDDTERPLVLIGTRIADVSTLISNGFEDYLIDYTDKSNMTYEEYYYLLDEDDLDTIGIENNTNKIEGRSYIVNYSTGEVFDIENKTYYISENSIYLEGTNSELEEQTYNFTDE